MLKSELIVSKYSQLPVIDEFVINYPRPRAKDEAWEGNDSGGHFRLFRCRDKTSNNSKEHIILSISGSEVSRGRIISNVSEVFGEPISVKGSERWRRKVKSPKIYVVWEKHEAVPLANLGS